MGAIRPQSGPQEQFLATSADIGIYGGSAGGGKTWAILLESLRHAKVPDFASVIFRRNLVQVTNPGGLWDEANKLYSVIPGATSTSMPLQWTIGKARVRFAHLQDEKTVYDWQGAQIPLICFDELTHFSKKQFFYMLSRNRSMCGVRPYIRATCNPDADSWVAEFISWWIDPKTGLPIPERAGKLRWFVRIGDVIQWADRPEDLPVQRAPDGQIVPPKSVTFIPAKLSDNAALMAADPGYYANLMSLPTVERERLLGGNWKIRPAAGFYFQRAWCPVIDTAPTGLKIVRYWDLAATPKTEDNDPDWTVGVKLGLDKDGRFYVLDVIRMRVGPAEVETALKNVAALDGKSVRIGLPQDPGQAGKSQVAGFIRMLKGYTVSAARETGDKVTRFGAASSQAKVGNITLVRGPWMEDFCTVLEAFPLGAHDDDADALAGAMELLISAPSASSQPLSM
jgi:predicted phage terminase large subunit-like protein